MADEVSVLDALAAQRSIAAEEIMSKFYQFFKLVAGDDDSTVPIKGSADFGLCVDVKRVPRAENAPTLTNVPVNTGSVPIAELNVLRKGLIVCNDSSQVLRIAYAATASATATSYIIDPGEHWEMPLPIYPGQISGIWAGEDEDGAARVTELT